MRSTASLAPPCSGPYSAAVAAAVAEYGSTCELPTPRMAVEEQFCSWSACRMNRMSSARSSVGFGRYFSFGGAEQHIQEIAAVAQVVVRIGERHAEAVPVRERRERRHLADQAVGLLAARIGIENVLRVGIKRGKRRDGGDQHAHRMRVVVKPVEKFLDALVNERVVRDVVGPIRELRLRGELAV